MKETETITIRTPFIKLQDALKLADAVGSGGEAKIVIQEGAVQVNGQKCILRGKKLVPGDTVTFAGRNFRICAHEAE